MKSYIAIARTVLQCGPIGPGEPVPDGFADDHAIQSGTILTERQYRERFGLDFQARANSLYRQFSASGLTLAGAQRVVRNEMEAERRAALPDANDRHELKIMHRTMQILTDRGGSYDFHAAYDQARAEWEAR